MAGIGADRRSGLRPRRLSRRFSAVGVEIAPARLRQIAVDGPANEQEWVDVNFALAAVHLLSERRRSRRVRLQRRVVHWAVVTAAVAVALNLLLGLGLVFFVLTQHATPY